MALVVLSSSIPWLDRKLMQNILTASIHRKLFMNHFHMQIVSSN